MAAQVETEVILYDLACTTGTCFSPAVWRIRLMLNYKNIPYKTVFVEFPDIEPTLKNLGIPPHDKNSPGYSVDYTVPTIHHLPTNTYLMDSAPISAFLESIYPEPPLPLTSELGREVQQKLRKGFSTIHARSLRPRELGILSPCSQDYFRGRVEPMIGHPLEDLLADPNAEEEMWKEVHDGLERVNDLMRTHAADGPFLLGADPSFTDFALVGSMQSARMISEAVFQRVAKYPAFKDLYEACTPWMERND